VNFEQVTHLTFDCYGTLIDWESGILTAVKPLLAKYGVDATDAEIIQSYARHEADAEKGTYKKYYEVLQEVLAGLARDFGFTLAETEKKQLSDSVVKWPPFADSSQALNELQSRFKLVILSNVDDAMFAESAKLLSIEFDRVFTAQQIGSYKPSLRNFDFALDRLELPKEKILHVAQSIFHDHVPAKQAGLRTAWINRKSVIPGIGVAIQANAQPDLEVPDMATLAQTLGCA